MTLLALGFWTYFLNTLVLLLGVFLMLVILIQRGKGGGLAGAFGGAGGSSPFGSRAGDMFTRITVVVAAFWVALILIQVKVVEYEGRNTVNQTTSGGLPGL